MASAISLAAPAESRPALDHRPVSSLGTHEQSATPPPPSYQVSPPSPSHPQPARPLAVAQLLHDPSEEKIVVVRSPSPPPPPPAARVGAGAGVGAGPRPPSAVELSAEPPSRPPPARENDKYQTTPLPSELPDPMHLASSAPANQDSAVELAIRPDCSPGATRPGSAAAAPTHVHTVTPLHLLHDQPDVVDCPFCRRRAETRVRKYASPTTHMIATALCLGTLFGVAAPYLGKWAYTLDHHCTNCDRVVAQRLFRRADNVVFGTPDNLREVSRYPAAEVKGPQASPPPPCGRGG